MSQNVTLMRELDFVIGPGHLIDRGSHARDHTQVVEVVRSGKESAGRARGRPGRAESLTGQEEGGGSGPKKTK
jgi:hypothetical protein